ncbi:hypothetical protein [Limnohabitans sp. DM1]|uniref:hypothetical protein n=1 Tax=Limnohabitans sp. DM1 TaxID=1597955 RepID=UPI001E59879F|nr:hypothetical protein [Limnohabitans sp. DM1]
MTPDMESAFADYFRDPDAVADSPLAYQIENNAALVEALRSLFQGPGGLVRLRVWVLLTLVQQGSAYLSREVLDQLFYAVRPEALDSVVKRLREAALLSWDETQRHYGLTALAQQVATMLAPLTQQSEDELSGLLGQVVGADRLGTLDGAQVQMLQAQLGRLHHEFADAIASGSEFRLREARKRYDRASRLIDKASDTITAIIGNARGQLRMEQAARGLGQAQSRLLAMASQFNRALQQVDRQRVTLGTTGITSTDVKLWLQTQAGLESLMEAAIAQPVGLSVLSPHDMLDVTEAEFERDRPKAQLAEALPTAQAAPVGDLTAVALPQELGALSDLLAQWGVLAGAEPGAQGSDAAPVHWYDISQAVLHPLDGEDHARYAQVAYKTQLMPLLGDAQAQDLPGPTGQLARQPWRVQWQTEVQALDHPAVSHLSAGLLRSIHAPDTPESAAPTGEAAPNTPV